MCEVELLALNCRGLRSDENKRNCIFSWLKGQTSPDAFLFLSETHSSPDIETKWEDEIGRKIIFSHGKTNSKGVCLIVPDSLKSSIIKFYSDSEGRFIIVDISLNETIYTIAGVYAPTKTFVVEQQNFLRNLIDNLNEFSSTNLLIGGDFNIILDDKIDKKGGIVDNISPYKKDLLDFIENFSLCDIWRDQHPNVNRFSWRQPKPLIQCRLDFWLISTHLSTWAHKTKILNSIKTDHNAVTVLLRDALWEKRGRGFWKFDASLLLYTDYVNELNETIKDSIVKYESLNDRSLAWDMVKCDIRSKCLI